MKLAKIAVVGYEVDALLKLLEKEIEQNKNPELYLRLRNKVNVALTKTQKEQTKAQQMELVK